VLGLVALAALLTARLLTAGHDVLRDSAARQQHAELEALADGEVALAVFTVLTTSRPEIRPEIRPESEAGRPPFVIWQHSYTHPDNGTFIQIRVYNGQELRDSEPASLRLRAALRDIPAPDNMPVDTPRTATVSAQFHIPVYLIDVMLHHSSGARFPRYAVIRPNPYHPIGYTVLAWGTGEIFAAQRP
jgi:hypothetical protein